jgi:anti-anti-sigma factor
MSFIKKYLDGIFQVNVETVSIEGEAAEEFKKIIDEHIDVGEKNILINMPQVVFLDSFALTALFQIFYSLKEKGGIIKLICPLESVKKILTLTRFTKVMEIYDDEETAIESFIRKKQW